MHFTFQVCEWAISSSHKLDTGYVLPGSPQDLVMNWVSACLGLKLGTVKRNWGDNVGDCVAREVSD